MTILRRYTIAYCFVALLFFERELRAYADPGSGALLWQLLVGLFVGGMYAVRKVLARFHGSNTFGHK